MLFSLDWVYFSSFFVLYSRQVINILFLFYSSISEGGGTRGEGSVVACGHATYIGYIGYGYKG